MFTEWCNRSFAVNGFSFKLNSFFFHYFQFCFALHQHHNYVMKMNRVMYRMKILFIWHFYLDYSVMHGLKRQRKTFYAFYCWDTIKRRNHSLSESLSIHSNRRKSIMFFPLAFSSLVVNGTKWKWNVHGNLADELEF